MKTFTALLIALATLASVTPAYAGGMHCYMVDGKQFCCTTTGMFTYCN